MSAAKKNKFMEAALEYAALGWHVFPCRPGSKEPATEHGFKDASTSEHQIRAWWNKIPEANVAIATGPKSGIWVLDCDIKDDGPKSINEIWKANRYHGGSWTQQTGSGGRHWIYLWADGVRNRAKFAPGLDVRGDGGYIVVAPSVLRGGGEYEWKRRGELELAPEWLLNMVIKHAKSRDDIPIGAPPPRKHQNGNATPYGEAALDAECATIAKCPPGSQDDTLIRRSTAIGSLVGGGEINFDYAVNALTGAAMQMVDGDISDPWTPSVVEAKVRRGVEYGMRDPRSAPEKTPRGAAPYPGGGPISQAASVNGGSRAVVATKPQLITVDGAPVAQEEKGKSSPKQNYTGLPEDWEYDLPWVWKEDGVKKPANLSNIALTIQYHPQLVSMFSYNEMADTYHISKAIPDYECGDYPREITDNDETALTAWLSRNGLSPSMQIVSSAIRMVGKTNTVNPLKAYLEGLEWDGIERVDRWLTYYAGARDTDYTSFVGKLFLLSAAARAYSPGCKCDTMLILEGPQGLRKSSLARELAGAEFFSDQIGDITNKDSQQLIQGRWIIEVPEMDKLGRPEMSAVKDYLARQADRYRPPYGRNVVERPRRCVFIGTINPTGSGYLKDPTGARRFWPVDCRKIDLNAMRLDRDQLWAEAVFRYKRGERWWVEDSEIDLVKGEQTDRIEDDVWEPTVEAWLSDRRSRSAQDDGFTTSECLLDCMKVEISKQGYREKVRVVSILTKLGLRSKASRQRGRPMKLWLV